MTIWKMNLIDNREPENRNKDAELKFRICMEKSILGIGWGLNAALDDWEEYRKFADCRYKDDQGYPTAVRAINEMACGDLVWTQNPVTHERYLLQVTDDKPSLCCHLREFDIFSCRKVKFIPVGTEILNRYELSEENISGRHAIERAQKQSLIDMTEKLYEAIR